MKNILFLTNYGKHAIATFQYALQLAKHFKARIHAIHVYDIPLSELVNDLDTIDIYYGHYKDQSDTELQEEVTKLNSFINSNIGEENKQLLGEVYPIEGDPIINIMGISSKDHIDLIVMGMHQQSRMADAIFGNLSLQMIEQSTCPVLLIPEKSEEIAINRIVLTTDFGIDDTKTIQNLLRWAAAFEAHLYVLHVSTKSPDRITAERDLQKWKRYFGTEIGEDRLSFYVTDKEKGKSIEESIEKFIENIKADLVCLRPHSRSFWSRILKPSITKDVARMIEIPVLVLK